MFIGVYCCFSGPDSVLVFMWSGRWLTQPFFKGLSDGG